MCTYIYNVIRKNIREISLHLQSVSPALNCLRGCCYPNKSGRNEFSQDLLYNFIFWILLQVCLELSRTTSTPESSQTDSDDVSPQIQRKRRTGHSRDMLPRFSISVEDDHSSLETCTSSSENNRDLSPVNRNQTSSTTPVNRHRSRSVIKSASASGLSLMIPSGTLLIIHAHFSCIKITCF